MGSAYSMGLSVGRIWPEVYRSMILSVPTASTLSSTSIAVSPVCFELPIPDAHSVRERYSLALLMASRVSF